MNRRIILAAVLACLAALAGPALGDGGGFYIEGKIGASQQKIERDVTVNSPLQDATGTLELRPGAIPIGTMSHSSMVGGLAFGYNFAPGFDVPLRLELELLARGYRDVNQSFNVRPSIVEVATGQPVLDEVTIIESSKIGVHTIMGNLYYDFYIDSAPITPFVGGGLGLSILHVKIDSIEIEDYYSEPTSFHAGDVQLAWGLTGGASYALNNDWSLSMAYKYTDAGSKSLTAGRLRVGLDSDVQIHDVLLGLRYGF